MQQQALNMIYFVLLCATVFPLAAYLEERAQQ